MGVQEHKHVGEGCDDWQSQEHKWFTSKNNLMRMLALAQRCRQMLAVRATWAYLCIGRYEKLEKVRFCGPLCVEFVHDLSTNLCLEHSVAGDILARAAFKKLCEKSTC